VFLLKTALDKIHELNNLDDQNILVMMGPSLQSTGQDSTELMKDKEAIHKYVSHKRWKHGSPKNTGYAVWGLTEFADMSAEEFKTTYLRPDISDKIKFRESHHRSHPDSHHHHHHHGESMDETFHKNNLITRKRRALSFAGSVPDKVDWRTKGVITPVLHQKACGACWAFSTIETVESMRAIQTGKLEPLSIQYVIDCATNGNMGCNGGDTCGALSWMTGTKLVTASQYPLTLKDASCLLRSSNAGVQVNSNYTCDKYYILFLNFYLMRTYK
jgi:cathepsin O